MIKEKLPVHYITEKKDIYNLYCEQINECLTIILINKDNYEKPGEFLEKYLTIILKLKAVLSGKINALQYIT